MAAGYLEEAIARMAAFLAAVCHTDGDIPLFNDAALDASAPPAALLALAAEAIGRPVAARPSGCYALADTGIYVLAPQDDSARMLVKAAFRETMFCKPSLWKKNILPVWSTHMKPLNDFLM